MKKQDFELSGIQERIDRDFQEELKKIRIERIKNGLEEDLIPIRELTRMITNTEGWKKSTREELAKKPRKKDD